MKSPATKEKVDDWNPKKYQCKHCGRISMNFDNLCFYCGEELPANPIERQATKEDEG
jgi:uncharacterized OB-fold protein